MEVDGACALINHSLVFRPGWEFNASSAEDRFAKTVKVEVRYPAQNFNQEHAPDYEVPIEGGATASFFVRVHDCDDVQSLFRKMLDVVARIDSHEAREALRIAPTMEAPFHPHNVDGMERFGDVHKDLYFGAA